MSKTFAIIGCGRVGRTLARQLTAAGYEPVGFASRSRQSAEKAASISGRPENVYDDIAAAAKSAGLVFLTTPDHAIAPTCRTIADGRGFQKDAVVLHCSGALSSDILKPAGECGASVGSMHPLQSFAAVGEENPFVGIKAAVEGDPAALALAREVAGALGADPISIRTEGKTLYHAAAVVASNYLVTLMRLSFDLLEAAGVESSETFDVLKPLINGTLTNIEGVGIPDALTGPIARGDVETVANHLSAIRELSEEAADLYARVGIATIEVATAKGDISQDAARELTELLNRGDKE